MLNALQYLSNQVALPACWVIGQVAVYLVMQVVGEVMEFFGKVAPSFMRVRRRAKEKKAEEKELRDMLKANKEALEKYNKFFQEVNSHYDDDNISKRDCWMHEVDEDRVHLKTLEEVILRLRNDVQLMRIEAMRNEIMSFASRVADDSCIVTREQYHRIFRLYDNYEKILAENNMENGEIDVNYQIVKESYEKRMKTHSFQEDMRNFVG